MEEKTAAQLKRDALLHQKKNGWDLVDEATEQAIFDYCEGYKIAEIARLIGKSESAVAKNLSRGREMLRATLGGEFE